MTSFKTEAEFGRALNQAKKARQSLLIAAVLLVVGLFTIQAYLSQAGRFMPAIHGDWSSHASTTRAVFLGEDFSSQEIKSTLGEFASYPRLTYELSAKAASTLGIADIQGLSLVSQLSIILACVFFSLRLCTFFADWKCSVEAKLIVAAVLLISSLFLGLGFRDSIIYNSFISQIASLAIAQVFIYTALTKPGFSRHVVIMLLSAFVLSQVHMVGFIWCLATLVVMAMGMPDERVFKRILLAAIGSAITFAFLLSSEGLMSTFKIAGTGGALAIANGVNLSNWQLVIVLPVIMYLMLSLFLLIRLVKKDITIFQAFWYGAGFIALAPLLLASELTVLSRGGNWYPVAKWVYTFIPEMLMFYLLLVGKKRQVSLESFGKYSVITLLAFAFVQIPVTQAKVDLQPAILAESGVKHVIEGRRYPSLSVDHPAINYFIARSILKIPYDKTTFAWIESGISNNPLIAADFNSLTPEVEADKRIKFRSDNKNRSIAQRMITTDWWPIEHDHVWASKSPANLQFIASQDPKSLIIYVVPHLFSGVEKRTFEVYINDVKLPDIYADRMDWSNPVEYKVDIPAEAIRDDKQAHIQFKWKQENQADLGLALMSIRYL